METPAYVHSICRRMKIRCLGMQAPAVPGADPLVMFQSPRSGTSLAMRLSEFEPVRIVAHILQSEQQFNELPEVPVELELAPDPNGGFTLTRDSEDLLSMPLTYRWANGWTMHLTLQDLYDKDIQKLIRANCSVFGQPTVDGEEGPRAA
jgi:hypothetical protein